MLGKQEPRAEPLLAASEDGTSTLNRNIAECTSGRNPDALRNKYYDSTRLKAATGLSSPLKPVLTPIPYGSRPIRRLISPTGPLERAGETGCSGLYAVGKSERQKPGTRRILPVRRRKTAYFPPLVTV